MGLAVFAMGSTDRSQILYSQLHAAEISEKGPFSANFQFPVGLRIACEKDSMPQESPGVADTALRALPPCVLEPPAPHGAYKI